MCAPVTRRRRIRRFGLLLCYRDARWSPDGSYMIFAFQDLTLGGTAPTVFYYIPSGQLGNETTFQPLPLDPNFFKNAKEAPQFALRPTE